MKESKSHTTVIFVRHGEATHNAENIFAGHIDSDLTEKGKRQARERGQQFQREGIVFNAAYSSKLRRARQTAEEIVSETNENLPVREIEGLEERYFGYKAEKELLTRDQYAQLLSDFMLRGDIDKMNQEELHKFHLLPGMESNEEVQVRGRRSLKRIARKHIGETILVVSHGNFMREQLVSMGFGSRVALSSGSVYNTGYAILETSNSGKTFNVLKTEGIIFAKPETNDSQADIYLKFHLRRSCK